MRLASRRRTRAELLHGPSLAGRPWRPTLLIGNRKGDAVRFLGGACGLLAILAGGSTRSQVKVAVP
jgi:hypothetical protein